MDPWIRQELEDEFYAQYDSVHEAYYATAEDARKFAESEEEYWNDYYAELEEANHQAQVDEYYRYLAEATVLGLKKL